MYTIAPSRRPSNKTGTRSVGILHGGRPIRRRFPSSFTLEKSSVRRENRSPSLRRHGCVSAVVVQRPDVCQLRPPHPDRALEPAARLQVGVVGGDAAGTVAS